VLSQFQEIKILPISRSGPLTELKVPVPVNCYLDRENNFRVTTFLLLKNIFITHKDYRKILKLTK